MKWLLVFWMVMPSGQEHRIERQFRNESDCQTIASYIRYEMTQSVKKPKQWSVTCSKQ